MPILHSASLCPLQFVRTPHGWREVLVDHDHDPSSPRHFRFVLSPHPTPASKLLAHLFPSRAQAGTGGPRYPECDADQGGPKGEMPRGGTQSMEPIVDADNADRIEFSPHAVQLAQVPALSCEPRATLLDSAALASLMWCCADTARIRFGHQTHPLSHPLATHPPSTPRPPQTLSQRVQSEGGAALVMDYGQDAPYSASLIGIRGHRGVHPLSSPGATDLSAWVDFSSLRAAAATTPGVSVFGPVAQGVFLKALGIDVRLDALTR